MKDTVGKEIEKLVSLNVFGRWLCPFRNIKQFPLPRIEEMFAKRKGGQEFTRLDLSTAYQQRELDEAPVSLLQS